MKNLLNIEKSAFRPGRWWVNPGHPRGTVCVLRESAGSTVALAVPQSSYREYSGCFSLL